MASGAVNMLSFRALDLNMPDGSGTAWGLDNNLNWLVNYFKAQTAIFKYR